MLAFFGKRQNCSPAGAIIWGIVLPCLALHWVALSCCMPHATRLGVPFVVQLFHGLKSRRHKDTIACNNPCEIGQQQCNNALTVSLFLLYFPLVLLLMLPLNITLALPLVLCLLLPFFLFLVLPFVLLAIFFNILCVLFLLLLQQGTYSCLRSTFTLSLIVLSS